MTANFFLNNTKYVIVFLLGLLSTQSLNTAPLHCANNHFSNYHSVSFEDLLCECQMVKQDQEKIYITDHKKNK